jgi:predicted membrane channel-forming protein YqfA (hemolysin III family)
VRIWLAYAAAVIVGIGTPVFALWVARGTPVGSDPAFAGAAVVVALGIISGLLSLALPRHWIPIALVVSAPLCLLGVVMFVALARVDEFFWVWLWVALGGVAASLASAFFAARAKRA